MGVSTLLVDDNRFDRELARWALARIGKPFGPLRVLEAQSWEEARPLFEEGRIDLVLLDFNLPGLCGLDVLEEVRGRSRSVPIVMLTGQDDVATAVATLRAGACDYVRKGEDWASELSRAVERVLERVQLERQLADARERLAGYAAELERRVDRRTAVVRAQAAEIEALYRQAQETARANAAIVSNVSHELRTVLDAMLGHVEVLHDELAAGSERSTLAVVRSQVEQCRALIEALLDVDRGDARVPPRAVTPPGST
jgi:DNA-binding NtrC family response regulator